MLNWRYFFSTCLWALLLIPAAAPAQATHPDACIQSYVWREAYPGDHVCVTPETRAEAARDNEQAAARRQPEGGAYGPDTCKPGFVWREARPQDHVCVTPEVRRQTADDNGQAPARRVAGVPRNGHLPAAIMEWQERTQMRARVAPATPAMQPMVATLKLPEFPWPPPPESARLKIGRTLLVAGQPLPSNGDVAGRMEQALADNGYTHIAYYAVPDGFAMVTQIERISPDAAPAAEQRWSTQIDPVTLIPFSLEAYLKALLGKDGDLFRILVFTFTPTPFAVSDKKVDPAEAFAWVDKGISALPEQLASLPYDPKAVCTALIYEFKISSLGPAVHRPSAYDGLQHLRAAGILGELERQR